MTDARTDRRIYQTASTEFDPYDFDGPLQENMSYLKLDYDMDSRQGAYLIRMEAGTETIAHEHKRREEYYILEGELIEDDGTVRIASSDRPSTERAVELIKGLTEEAEVGKVYSGVVKRIMDFGAFVEILPGTEGLVHISQLAFERVEQVTDILKEGDEVNVRVLDIDRQGRIRLSRKEALPKDD